MRFIRKEVITTTAENKEINDEEIIKSLFQTIKENQYDSKIIFQDENENIPTVFNKSRIDNVDLEKMLFDATLINKTNSIKRRNIKMSSVIHLEIIVNSSDIFLKKKEISKSDILEI